VFILLILAEFVGPYSDLPIGLYKVAKYYYTPGWNDPGSPVDCVIIWQAYRRLPKDPQAVVATACQAMNNDLPAEYTARTPMS